jgi:precorrin-2/cobalt-factor-2 C20-methyltransferase
MKGRFYAVGVGPGDPELLTVKAIRIISESDVIAVPRSGSGDNIALKIAGEYVEGKDILECDMPMIKDKEELGRYHDRCAEEIGRLLDEGKDVAFLTLGDPAIYSTVMYVHRRLEKMGYHTAMIPGITSFCGAAASLNVPLCERDQVLHIIPATFKGHMDQLTGTRVLMKSGRSIMKMKDELAEEHAMMVEKATMADEKIYRNMGDLKEQSSYFSLIIVPDKESEEE